MFALSGELSSPVFLAQSSRPVVLVTSISTWIPRTVGRETHTNLPKSTGSNPIDWGVTLGLHYSS
jgi:hypothetical protein